MKINAIIESKDGGTLVLDFPRSIYDVYEKLQSVGIRQSPHQITLSDEEGDDVRVKLYSEDETGKHLFKMYIGDKLIQIFHSVLLDSVQQITHMISQRKKLPDESFSCMGRDNGQIRSFQDPVDGA